jgi:hypothetical protein
LLIRVAMNLEGDPEREPRLNKGVLIDRRYDLTETNRGRKGATVVDLGLPRVAIPAVNLDTAAASNKNRDVALDAGLTGYLSTKEVGVVGARDDIFVHGAVKSVVLRLRYNR